MAPDAPGSVRRVVYRSTAEFEVADDPSRGCYFALGVRRSGSTLLNKMLHSAAAWNGIRFVDVPDRFFELGIGLESWRRDPALCALIAPGNLYGGFRDFPIGLAGCAMFRESRKVLLVRDPRDALVSEYFSNAYSHAIPQGGEQREAMLEQRAAALATPIAEYVVRSAPALARTLREYRAVARDSRLLLLRYEDVVFDKRRLLREVCAFFSWDLTEEQILTILSWADERPEQEDPRRFVRKVAPGDHREKLSSETIARLDYILGAEMALFGYGRPPTAWRSLRSWVGRLVR